jgi:hypothetical protein
VSEDRDRDIIGDSGDEDRRARGGTYTDVSSSVWFLVSMMKG